MSVLIEEVYTHIGGNDLFKPYGLTITSTDPNMQICFKGNVPKSITLIEFKKLFEIVVRNNVQSALEIGTGFGISSLAIGMGLKQTGGKGITVDSYIEAKHQNAGSYRYSTEVDMHSDAYACANKIHTHFDIEETMTKVCGNSPEILPYILKGPLDFVFIDSGHFEEQLEKELLALIPFITPSTILMIHDAYPYLITSRIENLLLNKLNRVLNIEISHPDGENLARAVIKNQ